MGLRWFLVPSTRVVLFRKFHVVYNVFFCGLDLSLCFRLSWSECVSCAFAVWCAHNGGLIAVSNCLMLSLLVVCGLLCPFEFPIGFCLLWSLLGSRCVFGCILHVLFSRLAKIRSGILLWCFVVSGASCRHWEVSQRPSNT